MKRRTATRIKAEVDMQDARIGGDFIEELTELRLLHLADSSLPIGALAHSFGLETLVSRELLRVSDLPEFLSGFLEEAGFLEAVFCRAGCWLSRSETFAGDWVALNERLSAMKPARESRAGSASLGKNFLTAVAGLGDFEIVRAALRASSEAKGLVHHSVAFGLASEVLGIAEERAVMAYVHQSIASLVSACQRLLPLGQSAATKILWELKPAMIETVARSAECGLDDACCFMPILDWGAMEHAGLTTRLFVS
jgi:urease accessory protein